MTEIVPLIMLAHGANQNLYRRRLHAWHNVLRDGATPLSGDGGQEDSPTAKGQIWYVQELEACLRLGKRVPPVLPEGEFEIATFRLGSEPGEPWLVQINLPHPTTEHGDTRLAREDGGQERIWLMRRGRLRPNGNTGAISEDEFQDRRLPDDVRGYDGTGLYPGAWYKVAMLDGPSEEIRAETKRFLQMCDVIRGAHEIQVSEEAHAGVRGQSPVAMPPVEPGNPYKIPAQAEKLVEQRQAKILKRLVARLHAAGVPSVKVCWKGYACDLLLQVEPKKILIEIKTGTLANDIYTGVGQLTLYPRRLGLKEPLRRVLLLPHPSRADLVEDVRAGGIEVGFFQLKGAWNEEDPEIEFLPEFRAICGIP